MSSDWSGSCAKYSPIHLETIYPESLNGILQDAQREVQRTMKQLKTALLDLENVEFELTRRMLSAARSIQSDDCPHCGSWVQSHEHLTNCRVPQENSNEPRA